MKMYPSLSKQEFKQFQEFVLAHPSLHDDYQEHFKGRNFSFRDAFEYQKHLDQEAFTLRRFIP